jgi:beta-phosphoglucomutase
MRFTLPRRFRAAIFDFDETMIDLEPQHTAAYSALCLELGSDYRMMPEAFRTGSGRRVIDDVLEMRELFGWTMKLDDLMDIRQRHFDNACALAPLELLPGVERVARDLRAHGATLAVTSSAVASSIDAILRRTGIRSLFELIVDGSEVIHAKPDPEAYLLTAHKLRIEPEECVVFEDSHVGVLAARGAGMYCVAIRNPLAQQYQDLRAADVVLHSFEDITVEEPAELSSRA